MINRQSIIALALTLTSFTATQGMVPARPISEASMLYQVTEKSAEVLENEYVALKARVAGETFAELTFTDKVNGRTYNLGPDIFSVTLQTGDNTFEKVSSRDFIAREWVEEDIPADPNARRLADRRAGKRVTLPFSWTKDGLNITWMAEIREGQPFVRLFLNVGAEQSPMPVRKITVLDFEAPDAVVQGSVKGAPVTANGNRLFMGVEHPLALNDAKDGRVSASLERKLNLPSRVPTIVSAVLGVSNPGQLRRTFQLSYVNEERARPYGAFLNYNTWYDIGYFDPYDEKAALNVIKKYGDELVKKRGVKMDSFMMDDGWDDTKTLWQFHKGLPNEFKNVRKAAEEIKAGPGVWFSPWGGYGQPKENRIKAAQGKFETNDSGFALSGPKYYEHFKNMCLHMIKVNGVNHFKLDGTSGAETEIKGSKFSSDFEAIINLISELRDVRKDLYVNLTTGTWASPFWFGIADSIWRGNWDHEFVGDGTMRNKWMTFRDSSIYHNNVEKSPLFPINSLMTHGVIYTKRARGLDKVEGKDLVNEIWSGFGCGTQMQEIYVSPELLTDSEWDTLAAAAKWARDNEETLVDSHWVGGDPSRMEVYGWASWSPKKGIVTLRNPSCKTRTWSFDAGAVFELPAGAVTKFKLVSPKGDNMPVKEVEAGKPVSFKLEPFEVVVFEAIPETK